MYLIYYYIAEHWDKIKEYKNNHVHGQGVYSDLCCGTIYQNAVGNHDPEKLISLVFHIDGAPVVKSKSMNLWPIQCFIVELPPRLRYCFSNVLFCGLSCSPKKPDLKIFQERFVTEIEQLQGFEVQIEVNAQNISIQAIALHGHLADLVAKAPSLCFVSLMVSVDAQFAYILAQEFREAKGAFAFIHTPIRSHLCKHMHRQFCMPMQQKEQENHYLGSKVFLHSCMLLKYLVRCSWITCTLFLLVNF